MSLNRCTIIGRLSQNLEIRYTPNATAVAPFTLAVHSDYRTKDGEIPVDYVDCVAWREKAEFMARNMYQKGKRIAIDGHLKTRRYTDRDGNSRKVTEVVVDMAYFADGKEDSPADQPPDASHVYEEIEEKDFPF